MLLITMHALVRSIVLPPFYPFWKIAMSTIEGPGKDLPRTKALRQSILENELFSMSDANVLQMFAVAFEPELNALKTASPTTECESPLIQASTLPGASSASPSQQLYGADYVEVNRTLTGMLALKWLISKDYATFTCQQSSSVKLRPESFHQLRQLFLEGLEGVKNVYALLVATVVNDLGKAPDLASKVSTKVGKSFAYENHDMVVYTAAQANMIELLDDFPSPMRADLLLGLQFGSGLNPAQLAQAENVPGSLEGALMMKGHNRAFAIKYLELLLDVAGADGHSDTRGAKSMNEPSCQNFFTTRQVLVDIISGALDLRTGYDQVLTRRQQTLEEDGFGHLSVADPVERALLRLLTMSRTTDRAQGDLISTAFYGLPKETREALVNGLSVDGYKDGTAILPYYIPGLFAETLRNTATTGSNNQICALKSLMRLLTRVYHGTRPMPGVPGAVVECDLSFAQDCVKSYAFRTDPNILNDVEIPESAIDLSLINRNRDY